MDKMKMETPNMVEQNLEKIEQLFPNVITESKGPDGKTVKSINFEKLQQELTPVLMKGNEAYDFTWVGKKQAMVEANTPVKKTLRPCMDKNESVNWDKTENLYIEGDNLDVLKCLQESYLNKVKMIYIDPPYNTGNDSFIYPDDYAENKDKYDEEIGAVDDSGYRMFHNTETNGRFHSSWCSMMYPRLKLARNLLTDDGVIFISIEDHEVDNLKKICNEIFGDQNFIAILVRKVMEGGKSDSKGLAVEHEYCLCYSKNRTTGINKRIMKHQEHYNKTDSFFEERGFYYLKPLENGGLGYISSLDYPIIGPDGQEIFPGGKYGDNGYRWVWSKEKFDRAQRLGMIEFIPSQKDKTKYKVYYKTYEFVDTDGNKSKKELPYPTLYLDSFTNRQAINDLKKIFTDNRLFDYPKPISFCKILLEIASKEDSLILDFFSGSATTAHAVMQLNAEDGGHRKFIMVQLPELCDEKTEAYKAGYKNICEIGKERIRRAGKKIVEETGKADLDIGFRVLKLDDTNMKEIYYKPNEYNQDMLDKVMDNIKEDRTPEDLLYQCMLDWGLELSLPYERREISGFNVHIVNENELVACFDDKITKSAIEKIAELKPLRVVFRDSSFGSDADRINVTEIFKLKSPNTEIKVI